MSSIMVENNVPARMRDGVTLYADVYRPAAPGPYPVLLARTPYGKENLEGVLLSLDPVRAARAGYIVVVQDCRGTFASAGEFTPIVNEAADGYDSVEWAAQLPGSNGNAGMFGGSYFGMTQWAAAMAHPPHLRAIAPRLTPAEHHNGLYFRGGALELGFNLRWQVMMVAGSLPRRLAASGAPPHQILADLRRLAAALDRMSTPEGYIDLPLTDIAWLRDLGLADVLREVVSAGPAGPGFTVLHDEIDVPSFQVGGWYDGFIQGTLDNFTAVRRRGRGQGRTAALVVGPWSHLRFAVRGGAVIGELDFGMAASPATLDLTTDLNALQLRWFDRWLKGQENGVEREPVRVFVMGENRWRTFPEWPPPGVETRAWYVQPGGALGPTPPGAGGSATAYVYDPADPAPTLGGNLVFSEAFGSGVKDQRPLSARPDVLTFVGAPLDRPLTIMGRVTAQLFAASSAPDTDFVVRLIDVHPGGFMQNLCDGILRARYRNSLQEPRWLVPGEVTAFEIDLWSTAHVFGPGHRVAVQVTSSSFPRWDRNLNIATEPGAGVEGQPAQQIIWHSAAYPSCIWLPVLSEV